MTAVTDTQKIPYGLHRLWLTPYTDVNGTQLASTSYRMPIARTLAFAESEQFDTLDGDDKQSVAMQGKGATVDGQLEGGGVSLMIWSILTGGQYPVSGLGAGVVGELIKRGSDRRPYFRVDGQVRANDGGDYICRIFRCIASGKITSDFKYGTFTVTQADITGTPMPGDDDDYLYLLRANDTVTTIGATPEPNPAPIPSNVVVGTLTATSIGLSWNAVEGATAYVVQQSTNGTTFTDVGSSAGGAPTTSSTTITGLTTATQYWFQVAATVGGVTGPFSSPVSATTS